MARSAIDTHDINWETLNGHDLLELTDEALEAGYIPTDAQMEQIRRITQARNPDPLRMRIH